MGQFRQGDMVPKSAVQQQQMAPNSMRFPAPVNNNLAGSGMMTSSPSLDVNQGGLVNGNFGGGMMYEDVKPRIPPSKYGLHAHIESKNNIVVPKCIEWFPPFVKLDQ